MIKKSAIQNFVSGEILCQSSDDAPSVHKMGARFNVTSTTIHNRRLCSREQINCTTTATLNGDIQICIKSMMMPIDLRDTDLKPVGNGN